MLHRIGYIEQMGTGIMRMKNAAKEANIAEPKFELGDFFKATFKRSEAPSLAASDGQAMMSDDERWASDGDKRQKTPDPVTFRKAPTGDCRRSIQPIGAKQSPRQGHLAGNGKRWNH
ncbi:MAG: hypothetical protein FWB78_12100 [Treponema sp.]|nr:hypothetical protein [Treponema sp.]